MDLYAVVHIGECDVLKFLVPFSNFYFVVFYCVPSFIQDQCKCTFVVFLFSIFVWRIQNLVSIFWYRCEFSLILNKYKRMQYFIFSSIFYSSSPFIPLISMYTIITKRWKKKTISFICSLNALYVYFMFSRGNLQEIISWIEQTPVSSKYFEMILFYHQFQLTPEYESENMFISNACMAPK